MLAFGVRQGFHLEPNLHGLAKLLAHDGIRGKEVDSYNIFHLLLKAIIRLRFLTLPNVALIQSSE